MLPTDCFATDHKLLSLADAFALIAERVQPVTGEEKLALPHCLGRVLAAPVQAGFSQPPFANAAMDGYAIRSTDAATPGQPRPIAARIAAGHRHHGDLPAGCAVQIFTGAPLPDGFDSVVMQEECKTDGDVVFLPEKITAGSHVRNAGIDFKAGDVLLHAGRRLRPQEIGMAAAVGLTHLTVRRRLRIGLFSTGDELVEPGQSLSAGQIHDSNRPMLYAALTAMGFEVTDLGNLPDEPDALATAFGLAALDQDALISSGGVSVGGEDHVRAAIEQLGQIHFWKLALKPGKPLALGQIGNAVFIGLPGNPVSALISLLVVGRAVLHRLAGATLDAALPAPVMLPSAARLPRGEGRLNFLRGALVEQQGMLTAQPYPSQDSSLISSLVGSQGLLEIEIGTGSIDVGAPVAFRSYDSLMR